MAKLAAALPNGERNGLSNITGQLCDSPHVKHLVIAVVDCKSVVTDMDTGEITPTARILRIEPVMRADYGTAEALLRRALEMRHGAAVLPFDTEEELRLMMAEFEKTEFVPEPGDPGAPGAAGQLPGQMDIFSDQDPEADTGE